MGNDFVSEASNQNSGEGLLYSERSASQESAATVLAASEGEDGFGEAVNVGEYELNVPEGFTLEGERLEAATAFFRDNNMSQLQAQAAVEMFTQLSAEDGDVARQAFMQHQQQVEQWGVQARQEFGGRYEETVGLARTAVQAVNDPMLAQVFDETGIGNHPALIKAFAFFGRLARDSGMDGLGGSTANSSATDHKHILYPNL